MIDVLGLVLVIGAVAAIYVSSASGASTTLDVFTAYFRGVRPDPWPRGVQEEDADRPWGARRGTLATVEGTAQDHAAALPTVEEILRWRRSDGRVPLQLVRDARLRSRF